MTDIMDEMDEMDTMDLDAYTVTTDTYLSILAHHSTEIIPITMRDWKYIHTIEYLYIRMKCFPPFVPSWLSLPAL